MIPEIDFLPSSYREVRRRHQNRIWRRTIVVVFLTLVTLGTVRQREIHNDLLAKKKTLEDRVELMNQQLEDPDQLKANIKQAEIRADLLAGIELDESPAQVLRIISSALPQYVSLNEFQFLFEKQLKQPQAPGKKETPKQPEQTLPELVDLENLKARHTQENLVVNLQGISPDHLSISHYMSNLDQMGMFKEIDLIQSNETIYQDQPMRSFRLRIVVNAPGTYVPRIPQHNTAALDRAIRGGQTHE